MVDKERVSKHPEAYWVQPADGVRLIRRDLSQAELKAARQRIKKGESLDTVAYDFMEAIIVPCTQEKIWDHEPQLGAVPAKDAYTKPAFRQWRSYAERSGCPWFILSTKYGLIRPDVPIERYNVPVSAATADPALLAKLGQQGLELGLAKFDRVILLDWERFKPLVRAAVPDRSVRCELKKLRY